MSGTGESDFYIYLDPANIYESVMDIHYDLPYESDVQFGFEGFVISDAQLTYHGRDLPEEVSLNEIEVGVLIDIDDEGALPKGYEYYFVTYTITNKYHNYEEFYLGATSIFVVADDYRIVTPSSDVCYLDGRDLSDPTNKDVAREGLKIGETKTYTVAVILNQGDVEKGTLYFIPDYSIGQSVDASVTTFLAMKLS
jgi:hypothetical protein